MSQQVAEKGCTAQVISDDQAAEPVKDQVTGKLVYSMRGMYIADAKTIWPDRTDVEGMQVAMGEMYCHNGWHPTRTSKIIRIDREQALVETVNSIYRSTDGRLA
jgi:hypothetical protein